MARIFISYSHDSTAHRDGVLALADRLLGCGHDVRLDRFTAAPSCGWPRWMTAEIRTAERILCVCTPTYRSRFEGEEVQQGLGVSWEGHLLTTELYLNRGRTARIVPVYQHDRGEVPLALQAHDPLAFSEIDAIVSRLGGVVGPQRPRPTVTAGLAAPLTLGRLLDPTFRFPRPYRGLADYLPSQLLRAESAVVPFMGRTGELEDLDAWCTGGGARVRVVYGPGGAGKTRLALELAARRAVEGWRAGPLAWRHLTDEALEELFHDPIPLLLVVDYAETRPTEVVQVLRRLVEQRDTTHTRLLLLARGVEDWWRGLNTAVPELEGLTRGYPPIAVEKVEQGPAHADTAAETFARWQGRDVPSQVLDRGRTPLDRQIEALVAVMEDALPGMEGLLRHEDAYLERAAIAAELPHASRRLLPRVMALLTLAGGVAPLNAGQWIRAVPGLGDLKEAEGVLVVDLLRGLYPRADGGVDALRPDRVGEALVAREDTEGALASEAVDRGCATSALTNLTRLAATEDDRPLRRLIERRRDEVASAVIGVAQQTGDPVGRLLAESLRRDPNPALAARLAPLLPAATVSLRELAAVVQDLWLGAAATDEQRSARLNELSLRLGAVGNHEGALAAIEEAVRIRRRLAASTPAAFQPKLAQSLNNLSNCYTSLGRRAEALSAIEEAIALRRRLAAVHPKRELPGLATSLHNQANALAELGKPEEALAAIEESVRIRRRLVANGREDLRPKLALSLDNLSSRLAALGRRQPALDAIEEAVGIRRRLAKARPDAFVPDLARSLTNLSGRLGDLGKRDQALAAIQEAVALRRPLAAARPDAFLPELASALGVLSGRLAEHGRREQAFEAGREAVTAFRRLASTRRAAFLSPLATALLNLSQRLTDLGHREEALAAIDESVAGWRSLAQALPDAFLHPLARSLSQLSSCLAGLGRRAPALAAIEEAVEVQRRLAVLHPAAELPNLADYLNNLSNHLSALGRHGPALAHAEEAVALHRRLADLHPDAFTSSLGKSLNTLSNRMSALGRGEPALAAVQESVEIRRRLATGHPDTFLPELADALANLSVALSNLGRHQPALTAIEEAVPLYRLVAARRPAAFEHRLAGALNNLSLRLAAVGALKPALAAVEESVVRQRRLASARPEAFLPHLATALHSASNALLAVGRREQALSSLEECVLIRRGLVAEHRDAFLPDLASSLNNLSNCLSSLDQHEAALRAIEEAITILRRLATARPAVFRPKLARSLGNLASRLPTPERHEAALAAADESITILRELAARQPEIFMQDLAQSLWARATITVNGEPASAAASAAEALGHLTSLSRRLPAAFTEKRDAVRTLYLKACAAADLTPDPAVFADAPAVGTPTTDPLNSTPP